jgi:short-subunit dehydrogenase
MKATEWDSEAATLMAEVNFIGALRVLGQVVPDFVQRNAGHIVLIGSLSGFRGLPGAIGYGASKAALMHLAENLRIDLREQAIDVQVINPGFIRTRLSQKNAFAMPQIMEPEDAAARVVRAMKRRRFSTSFPAPFSWLFTLGQHLPIGLFHRIF